MKIPLHVYNSRLGKGGRGMECQERWVDAARVAHTCNPSMPEVRIMHPTPVLAYTESFPLQNGVGVENQYDQEKKDWKKKKLSQSKF